MRGRLEHERVDGTCPNGSLTAAAEPPAEPAPHEPMPAPRALDHLCAHLSSPPVLTYVAGLAEHGFYAAQAKRFLDPGGYEDFENLCYEGLLSYWKKVHTKLADPFTFSAGGVRGYCRTGIKLKITDEARRQERPASAVPEELEAPAVVDDEAIERLAEPLEWMVRRIEGMTRGSRHNEQTRRDAVRVLRHAIAQAADHGAYDEFLDVAHLRTVLSPHDQAALRDGAGKDRVRRVQTLLKSVVRAYAESAT